MFFELLYPILVLIIGFVFARSTKRLDERSIAATCLFIFFPAWLLRQTLGQDFFSPTFTFTLFFVVFHTGTLFVIAERIFAMVKVPSRSKHIFLICTVFISLVGLQIIQPLIGEPTQTNRNVATLIFYQLVLISTLGIFLGSPYEKLFEKAIAILTTPLPYILILGLILVGFQATIPIEGLEYIDSFLKIVLPLALLVSGIVLGNYVYFIEFNEYIVLLPMLLTCIVLRLLLSPLLAYVIVKLMTIEDMELARALVLSSGMPTGVFAAILTSVYGKTNEKRFAILCVFLTTVLCFITFPILFMIVNRWMPLP